MKINTFLHGRAVTVMNEVMRSPVSLEARCYLCMSKICFLISLMIKTLNLGIDLKLVRPDQVQDWMCAVGRAEAGPRRAESAVPAVRVRTHAGGTPRLCGGLPCGPAVLKAWLGFSLQSQGGSMNGCCFWAAGLALAQGSGPRPVVQGSDPGHLVQPLSAGIYSPRSTYELGEGKHIWEKHGAFPTVLTPTWFLPGLFFMPRGLKTHVLTCRGSTGLSLGFSAQAGAGMNTVGLLLSRRLRNGAEAVSKSPQLWKGEGIHGELEESATSVFS